jgi:diguanylate cyclase (GGDEF)-like protein
MGSDRAGWARSALVLALCGLVASLGVTAGITVLMLKLRAQIVENRLSELAGATLMLSTYADSALQSVESLQTGLIDQMRSAGIATEEAYVTTMTTAEIQRTLKDRVTALPYVNAVTLIDRQGNLLNFSRFWPIPKVNIADREYFKTLSSDQPLDHVVSEPVQNRGSGVWTAYIGRRFNAPDGSMLGLVLGAMELSYFQRLFAEVEPNTDAVISMFRDDGVMLVRQPPVGQNPGLSVMPLATPGLMTDPTARTTQGVTRIDRQDRLVATHALAHYPIVVSMSRTMTATLQPWWEQVRDFAAVAVLIDLSLAGLVLLGIRHLRNRHQLADAVASRAEAQAERAAAEEREQTGRTLAAYYSRFNTAVCNMSQGLCMFDASDRLIISNPRLGEIFGLSARAIAAGTSLTVAIRAAVRSHRLSARDIRLIKTRLGPASGATERGALVCDLADGRALSISFEGMAEQGWLMTFEDITERRRTEAQIAHMAHHDALTGLPNRKLFHQRLVTAVGLAARGAQHGVLCLDLDHFKDVNDALGHPIGDALLQAVTVRLLRSVRETDSLARIDGDEFAIILAGLHEPKDAATFAERLIEEITLPYEISGHQILMSVSIGIAVTPDDGADPDALLKNADLALYRAKADGRGCHRFFKLEMDAKLQARRRLALDLRRALASQEFELHYQPMVNVRELRVSGFEALLRWHRPGRPAVGPQEFIPVAEEIGLILPLGEWALEAACREAAGWPHPMTVAVNLSPVQFREPHLVQAVRGALDRSGLPPDRLELEITETVLLNDTADTLATLHQLRDLGVRISMDDFGTGYSSLSYLLKFPFDKVKIDRSFIRGLGESGECDVIIRAIMGMCNDLGIATIAEGVETSEQLAVLQRRNCTEVQGFLFSPAVPGTEIPALLRAFGPIDSTSRYPALIRE